MIIFANDNNNNNNDEDGVSWCCSERWTICLFYLPPSLSLSIYIFLFLSCSTVTATAAVVVVVVWNVWSMVLVFAHLFITFRSSLFYLRRWSSAFPSTCKQDNSALFRASYSIIRTDQVSVITVCDERHSRWNHLMVQMWFSRIHVCGIVQADLFEHCRIWIFGFTEWTPTHQKGSLYNSSWDLVCQRRTQHHREWGQRNCTENVDYRKTCEYGTDVLILWKRSELSCFRSWTH